jgi:hypothetical protein
MLGLQAENTRKNTVQARTGREKGGFHKKLI